MPDPIHRMPKLPPDEPIIIRTPPRPPEEPEIDGPPDHDDRPEIRQPPLYIPERRPPPAPSDRAA